MTVITPRLDPAESLDGLETLSEEVETEKVVRAVLAVLARRGRDVPAPEIRRRVELELRRYADAPVRIFISVLVERAVCSSFFGSSS